jgi:exonuclease III
MNCDSFKIVHYNINSLQNKVHFIEEELGEYDIICITESKLNDQITDEKIKLDGYRLIRRDRKCDNGGGIVTYVKDNLKVKRRNELENIRDKIMWLEVNINQNKNILLCICYRPQTTPIAFWSRLSDSIEVSLDWRNIANVIILGDLNDDLLDNRKHHIRELITKYNLHSLIDQPTRITPTTRTLLDPILVNKQDNVIDTGVIPPICSDHYATYLHLTFKSNKQTAFTREIWDYNQANYDLFNENIQARNISQIINNSINIDNACQAFTENVLEVAAQSIPKKEITVRP